MTVSVSDYHTNWSIFNNICSQFCTAWKDNYTTITPLTLLQTTKDINYNLSLTSYTGLKLHYLPRENICHVKDGLWDIISGAFVLSENGKAPLVQQRFNFAIANSSTFNNQFNP